jgi:uncharacterized caspase-like protein
MASNWAIAIGINEYEFLQPLKYAKRDAEMMGEFLLNEAKFDRIFLFTADSPPINGKSTKPFRANLLRVLREIFATPFMKDGDNFWFFFSGHGIRHREQDYLMPLDGDPEDIENTGISTHLITNYLRSCGADNVVLILDACRNGGQKSGEGIGRQTEAEARQTGVISIFSCSPDQYSYELDAIAQGAFTYALIDGLGIKGRCATVERLNQHLENKVPNLVSRYLGNVRQTPYIIAEPLRRSHLILIPQHASLADIATLKNDAYHAQTDENWDLAEQLWIRVLAAASGQDADAIGALQRIAVKRHTEAIPIPPDEPSRRAGQKSQPPASPPPVNPTYKREFFSTSKSDKQENEPQKDDSKQSIPPKTPWAAAKQPSSTKTPTETPHCPESISQTNQLSFRPLTRQQFLRWAVPTGVGLVGVAVVSQFSRDQLLQSPHGNSSDTISPSPSKASPINPSPSPTTASYSRLEEFLQGEQWKEAEQETTSMLLRAVGLVQEGRLYPESIENFPCEVLAAIDQLWLRHSNGRFGFSIQKRIWEEVGSPIDPNENYAQWNEFCDRVGWRVNNRKISLNEVNFDISAKPGHLPVYFYIYGWDGLLLNYFFPRTEICNL